VREEEFTWEARFSDGSVIKQYENDTENNFKSVLDKEKDLVEFKLVNDNKEFYSFNKLTGEINSNGEVKKFYDENKNELTNQKHDYRLIYFRRVTRQFNMGMPNVQLPETTWTVINFFLGWQITLNEKNIKKMIEIKPKVHDKRNLVWCEQ